jgi:uncharacterized XkdX family phage protein|uniref:XkdX family protein n=1 Tax=Siphoviridae sp. ctVqj4 TaxID=2826359 RepID=A0A8S5NJU7_9CAUD|nr:MAG TPA: hypothetical protein [Siphoviridae sp. ctVqj4]
MFKIVKRYYDRKLYTAEDVKKFVCAGQLTAEEYERITGEGYTE